MKKKMNRNRRITGGVQGMTGGGRSGVGRMEKSQMTRDNLITNRMVRAGILPQSELEVYPQKRKKK